jgi:RNA polymerase sigma factor (sigma-70 family)
MSIRVLLADDHAVVCDGLRMLLEAEGGVHVVGVAADGLDAVRQAVKLRPDVVVMDISMPLLNGVEATRQIREACSETQVVILSIHSSAEHIQRALQAGALGYLLKESAGAEVALAVCEVHAGRRYLSRKINEIIVNHYMRGDEMASALESLTPRQREVLQLLAEGHSTREIAKLLFISAKTVETHRANLMQKLGLDSLPALVHFAIREGLIDLDK